ncbi:hypothetical protein HYPSUDRAFT_32434 [Hypholoma sublateritium FD-334 SS-4]|uniref:Uncharacterized protein n=1 Tax=Hypholoma sublateritium (strain FD-334 SS-4) TaxID=945553 RepID=A0A0D2LM81_HYPSF|nr:hypothetical protein HYPSUDRAFT_32434 [Hypholoma sublateritium FD-334 SS-4]
MSTIINKSPDAWIDIRKKVEDTIAGQSVLDDPKLKKAAGISWELTNMAKDPNWPMTAGEREVIDDMSILIAFLSVQHNIIRHEDIVCSAIKTRIDLEKLTSELDKMYWENENKPIKKFRNSLMNYNPDLKQIKQLLVSWSLRCQVLCLETLTHLFNNYCVGTPNPRQEWLYGQVKQQRKFMANFRTKKYTNLAKSYVTLEGYVNARSAWIRRWHTPTDTWGGIPFDKFRGNLGVRRLPKAPSPPESSSTANGSL